MSKKKSKHASGKQPSSLQANEKTNIVLNFAYNLYSATKDSKSTKAVKELLVYKRKNFPGESLSGGAKQLLKYKRLMMDNDPAFDDLVFILLKATDDDEVKESVVTIIATQFYKDIATLIAATPRREAFNEIWERRGPEGFANYMSSPDMIADDFCLLLSTGWLYLSKYIELTDTLDILKRVSSKSAVRCRSTDDVTKDMSMLEDVGHHSVIFEVTDTQLMEDYKNDTEFYKKVTEECLDFITGMNGASQKRDSARIQYDYSLTLKSLYAKSMSEQKKLAKKMQADRVLAVRTPKEVIDCEDWDDPIRLWFVEAVNSLRCEYLLSGIDIVSIAAKHPFSPREGRNMVKKAFLSHDMEYLSTHGNGAECDYSNETDKVAIIRSIVRIWSETLIAEQIDSLMNSSSFPNTKASNELSEAMTLINKLKRENEQLKKKMAPDVQENTAELKKKNEEIKAIRNELHDATSALAKESARADELEQENKELRALFNMAMCEDPEEEPSIEEGGVDEEFFKEYIRNNKVLIWGLRTSTEQKYAETYPELSFAPSDRKLTRQQLESYEVFIMCTSNTNHSNYYAARDTAKAAGIKMAYLAKTMNDPKHLWWALGIALRGETAEK